MAVAAAVRFKPNRPIQAERFATTDRTEILMMNDLLGQTDASKGKGSDLRT